MSSRRDDSLFLTLRFNESKAELVEDRLQQLSLLHGEIAACFFFEQRQDVYHLAGGLQIDRPRLRFPWLEAIPEMHGCGGSQ